MKFTYHKMDDLKILIVEDEDAIRRVLIKIIKNENSTYEVDEAADGLEGLEKIKNADFDLVLCDIKMPKKNGYQVLEELSQIKGKENTPFIFLSSNIEREQIRKGMNLGADDYITKPFNTEELLLRIHAILKRSTLFFLNH